MNITIHNACRDCINSHAKCPYYEVYGRLIQEMYDVDEKIDAFKGVNMRKPFTKPERKYDPVKIHVECEMFSRIPEKPVKEVSK